MSVDDQRNPSEVSSDYWIYQSGPSPFSDSTAHGKWLVFDHVSKIDNTWRQIRDAVASGELRAVAAKVATAMPSPYAQSSSQKVICIYTTEQTINEVGLLLIQLPCIQRRISYKTDAATEMGLYAHRGDKKITCRTLYWNDGNPAFKE